MAIIRRMLLFVLGYLAGVATCVLIYAVCAWRSASDDSDFIEP